MDIKAGDRFGYWEVIEFVSIKRKVKGNIRNEYSYNCKCTKCNKTEKIIPKAALVKLKTLKCRNCFISEIKIIDSYKGVLQIVLNIIETQAKERKIPFNLTIQQLGDLFEKQEGLCALSKQPITLKKFKNDFSATASLDRKDSSKGYSIKNVQWVHKDINRLKGALTKEELIRLCKLIVENN